MVKELVEDIRRYTADREINARLVLIFDNSTKTFVQKPWRDVKVSQHVLPCKQFDCTYLPQYVTVSIQGSCLMVT